MHTLDFFLDTRRLARHVPEGAGALPGRASSCPASGSSTEWPTSRAPSGPASCGAPTRRPSLRHLELPPSEWPKLRAPRPGDGRPDAARPAAPRAAREGRPPGAAPDPLRGGARAAGASPRTCSARRPSWRRRRRSPRRPTAALDVFTDTVIAFLRAQLARLREPLGILVLDDLPGMLSPRGFDRMALPLPAARLRRLPRASLRIYHNDTPCAHLLPRMGQLHCEVWNFSHEMDIAAVRAAVPPHGAPRQRGAARHARAGHAGAGVPRGARRASTRSRRAAGSSSPRAGASRRAPPAEHIDALVRAARP